MSGPSSRGSRGAGRGWSNRAGILLSAVLLAVGIGTRPAAATLDGDDITLVWSSPILTIRITVPWLDRPCVRRPLLDDLLESATAIIRTTEEADALSFETDYALQPRNVPYWLRMEATVTYRSDRLISVLVEKSAYTGGAHEIRAVDAYLLDPKGCRVVSPREIFDWDRLASALAKPLTESFVRASRARGYPLPGPWTPMETALDSAAVSLLQGEGTRSCGLRLDFPPYALHGFAAGSFTFLVPSERILPFVRPRWRDLFVPAESSACDELPAFLPP